MESYTIITFILLGMFIAYSFVLLTKKDEEERRRKIYKKGWKDGYDIGYEDGANNRARYERRKPEDKERG